MSTAESFLKSGDYLWNAGIFIWSAKSILSSFKNNAPDIYDILEKGTGVYNTEEEQAFIDSHYPTTSKISVDYAILEKSDNIYTIPSDIGWSDLGTWASLHAESEKDSDGNVVQGNNIHLSKTNDCLVRLPPNKLAIIKRAGQLYRRR